MKDVEALLHSDRNAPIPEVPDAAFTAAVVARRLGCSPRWVGRSPCRPGGIPCRPAQPARTDWLLLCGAATVGVGLAAAAWLGGLPLLWLPVVPLTLLPFFPILRKGVR